jgi:glycine cleavage system H protein
MYPEDLRYTKDHEWIRLQGERGTIGITDHAQKQLGDVVFLELPAVGKTFAQHDSFGTVESVKAVSELFSPVSGEVLEANAALAQKPEKVNADPYGDAWMVVMKLTRPEEVAGLMDAAAYRAYVESEAK